MSGSGFSLKNIGYMSHAAPLGYIGIGLLIFAALLGGVDPLYIGPPLAMDKPVTKGPSCSL